VKNTLSKFKDQRFVFVQTVVFLSAILILSSCKDDELLGIELQPDGQFDTLAITDNLSIEAFTLLGEPQRSDEAQSFVGKVQSDQFGTSESSLLLNFDILQGNTDIDFTIYQVDSVVLSLRPNLIFGVPKNAIPIEVFELNETLLVSEEYQSDFDPEVKTTAIGSTTFSFSRQLKVPETVTIDTVTEVFQFRIKLDNELGEYLKEGIGDASAQSTEDFQEYFKGLMIKVGAGLDPTLTGAIYSMALLTGESGIKVYTSESGNVQNTEVIEYPITSKCARINKITHDYSSSLAQTYLDDVSNNDDLLFVQGLAGLRTEIHIPGLYEFGVNNNTAIAKAVLQFELANEQNGELSNSQRLYLLDLEKDGSESLTLDYIYSPSRSGGKFDEDINGYQFDITRHVQRIVQEAQKGVDVNYGLRLHAQVPVLNGNDTAHNVLKGLDNIALKLYHTDLNN